MDSSSTRGQDDRVTNWVGDQLIAEIERLGARGLPYDELHRELSARIRRAMPVDAACWHGLDPDTRLLTTANPVELLERRFLTRETEVLAAGAVVASEYQRPDFNTFVNIAGRRAPVAILSETTRGKPERSARYRDFLAPIGTPFEMRAAMVTKRRAWGCVVLHRSEASGDFRPEEARLMARASRPIAEALRQSLRFDAARRPESERAPGLLVLDAADDVELITPPTEALLGPMLAAESVVRSVPVSVLTLAADARRRGRSGQAPVPLHVPTTAGWITLHASLPDGGRSGRVAVVVQQASHEHVSPLRLETFGLTAREREIASKVARGHDTSTIAEELFISPWTVQDHLKSIFDKTGTRSRRELRTQVFFHDHLPAIAQRRTLDACGHLDDPPDSPHGP